MHRIHRTVVLSVVGVLAALSVPAAAVSALDRRASTARLQVPAADWTTYHHDKLRTGDGAIAGKYTALHPKFTWNLPTSLPSQHNDLMYASPLVVGHVAFVTTLENRVYAVSTATGRTVWSAKLGTPYIQPSGVCGDIGPTMGIVSTPVIDEGRGELYVVAVIGTGRGAMVPVHRIFGLSIANGRVELNRVVDPPGQQVIYLLQRASLAIAKGRVVFGFGGNGGDCGTYHGWVVSVPETGATPIDRYEVAAGAGQGRGAVWMGGAAPSVDNAGNVYVADGNGNATSSSDAFDFSDAVLKLTPTMHLEDWFAPTSWYSDNGADLDLGSGAPQLLGGGLLLQVGKTHTGYVLSQSNLGHIDPAVHTFAICPGADNNAQGGDTIAGAYVVVPCAGGLNAVKVSATAPYGTVEWTSPASNGAPVFAAGLVWTISGSSGGSTLYGLNPATGAVTVQYDFGAEANHFPTPAVGANMVLVASTTQLIAFPPG